MVITGRVSQSLGIVLMCCPSGSLVHLNYRSHLVKMIFTVLAQSNAEHHIQAKYVSCREDVRIPRLAGTRSKWVHSNLSLGCLCLCLGIYVGREKSSHTLYEEKSWI